MGDIGTSPDYEKWLELRARVNELEATKQQTIDEIIQEVSQLVDEIPLHGQIYHLDRKLGQIVSELEAAKASLEAHEIDHSYGRKLQNELETLQYDRGLIIEQLDIAITEHTKRYGDAPLPNVVYEAKQALADIENQIKNQQRLIELASGQTGTDGAQ